jgi:methylglyoxal synthase
MREQKTIALVAHDNQKRDLIEWVSWNSGILAEHALVCTGTTGRLVEEALTRMAQDAGGPGKVPPIQKLKSGPLGPHPHDVDVKALLRIAVVYNIPMACTRSTADFLISSPLMTKPYEPALGDYSAYIGRKVEG